MKKIIVYALVAVAAVVAGLMMAGCDEELKKEEPIVDENSRWVLEVFPETVVVEGENGPEVAMVVLAAGEKEIFTLPLDGIIGFTYKEGVYYKLMVYIVGIAPGKNGYELIRIIEEKEM